jgi:hypothetical protein
MDKDNFPEYEYMWTTHASEYFLLRQEFRGEITYLICHLPSRSDVIIEDDNEYEAIINNMILAGVKILDEFPE